MASAGSEAVRICDLAMRIHSDMFPKLTKQPPQKGALTLSSKKHRELSAAKGSSGAAQAPSNATVGFSLPSGSLHYVDWMFLSEPLAIDRHMLGKTFAKCCSPQDRRCFYDFLEEGACTPFEGTLTLAPGDELWFQVVLRGPPQSMSLLNFFVSTEALKELTQAAMHRSTAKLWLDSEWLQCCIAEYSPGAIIIIVPNIGSLVIVIEVVGRQVAIRSSGIHEVSSNSHAQAWLRLNAHDLWFPVVGSNQEVHGFHFACKNTDLQDISARLEARFPEISAHEPSAPLSISWLLFLARFRGWCELHNDIKEVKSCVRSLLRVFIKFGVSPDWQYFPEDDDVRLLCVSYAVALAFDQLGETAEDLMTDVWEEAFHYDSPASKHVLNMRGWFNSQNLFRSMLFDVSELVKAMKPQVVNLVNATKVPLQIYVSRDGVDGTAEVRSLPARAKTELKVGASDFPDAAGALTMQTILRRVTCFEDAIRFLPGKDQYAQEASGRHDDDNPISVLGHSRLCESRSQDENTLRVVQKRCPARWMERLADESCFCDLSIPAIQGASFKACNTEAFLSLLNYGFRAFEVSLNAGDRLNIEHAGQSQPSLPKALCFGDLSFLQVTAACTDFLKKHPAECVTLIIHRGSLEACPSTVLTTYEPFELAMCLGQARGKILVLLKDASNQPVSADGRQDSH